MGIETFELLLKLDVFCHFPSRGVAQPTGKQLDLSP